MSRITLPRRLRRVTSTFAHGGGAREVQTHWSARLANPVRITLIRAKRADTTCPSCGSVVPAGGPGLLVKFITTYGPRTFGGRFPQYGPHYHARLSCMPSAEAEACLRLMARTATDVLLDE